MSSFCPGFAWGRKQNVPNSTVLLLLAITLGHAHRDLEIQVEELGTLLQDSPSAELYLRRSELLGRLERPEEALADLVQAEALGEDVVLERALVLSDAGRGEEARSLLDEVLLTAPHWEAFRARARLHVEAGDAASAVRDLDAALELHVNPDLVMERGGVARALDAGLAADGYLEALQHLGPAVVVELAAAEALRDAGRPLEARSVLTAMIERSGPQPRWLLLRAEVSEASDAHVDRVQALELARERYEARPNDLNQMAIQDATAALEAEPKACTHTPMGGLLAALVLLWRRRCS